MLEETDPDVMVTVRKLVMVSLMEVFKDIIPGYRLRMATEKEKQQKVNFILSYKCLLIPHLKCLFTNFICRNNIGYN